MAWLQSSVMQNMGLPWHNPARFDGQYQWQAGAWQPTYGYQSGYQSAVPMLASAFPNSCRPGISRLPPVAEAEAMSFTRPKSGPARGSEAAPKSNGLFHDRYRSFQAKQEMRKTARHTPQTEAAPPLQGQSLPPWPPPRASADVSCLSAMDGQQAVASRPVIGDKVEFLSRRTQAWATATVTAVGCDRNGGTLYDLDAEKGVAVGLVRRPLPRPVAARPDHSTSYAELGHADSAARAPHDLRFSAGDKVQYWSASVGRWLKTVVVKRRQEGDTILYDLGCKGGVDASMLREIPPTVKKKIAERQTQKDKDENRAPVIDRYGNLHSAKRKAEAPLGQSQVEGNDSKKRKSESDGRQTDLMPGAAAFYWSANLNRWLRTTVNRVKRDSAGVVLAYDLECKTDAAPSRVSAEMLFSPPPSCNFAVGDCVQYLSTSRNTWIDTHITAVHSSDNVVLCYDLASKPRAEPGRVRAPVPCTEDSVCDTYKEGDRVQYWSETGKRWIKAVIEGRIAGTKDMYNLNCKKGVAFDRIRAGDAVDASVEQRELPSRPPPVEQRELPSRPPLVEHIKTEEKSSARVVKVEQDNRVQEPASPALSKRRKLQHRATRSKDCDADSKSKEPLSELMTSLALNVIGALAEALPPERAHRCTGEDGRSATQTGLRPTMVKEEPTELRQPVTSDSSDVRQETVSSSNLLLAHVTSEVPGDPASAAGPVESDGHTGNAKPADSPAADALLVKTDDVSEHDASTMLPDAPSGDANPEPAPLVETNGQLLEVDAHDEKAKPEDSSAEAEAQPVEAHAHTAGAQPGAPPPAEAQLQPVQHDDHRADACTADAQPGDPPTAEAQLQPVQHDEDRADACTAEAQPGDPPPAEAQLQPVQQDDHRADACTAHAEPGDPAPAEAQLQPVQDDEDRADTTPVISPTGEGDVQTVDGDGHRAGAKAEGPPPAEANLQPGEGERHTADVQVRHTPPADSHVQKAAGDGHTGDVDQRGILPAAEAQLTEAAPTADLTGETANGNKLDDASCTPSAAALSASEPAATSVPLADESETQPDDQATGCP